jgi:ABC-type spermidine/putrescine transport system permease subunit II
MPRGPAYGELRSRGLIRTGLVLLAIPSVVIAAWSLSSPRGFYQDFPGLGRHWVSALPPFNEHLLRDFGAANVTIALVLLGAALFCERRLVQVAVVAFFLGSLPHFIYHLTTTDHYSTSDNIWSLGGFIVELLIAIGVWALTVRTSRRHEPRSAPLFQR